MDPVVIIPVKSFTIGKQRLSSALDLRDRVGLGRALAAHVANVVEGSGLVPMFVTGDPSVAAWAAGLGFPSAPETGEGLNGAATAGVEWANQAKSPWLVLHADLPLIRGNDLKMLAGPLSAGADVIAPSADGGTSAIGSRGGIAFAFGPGSFSRHLTRLEEPRVLTSVGLLHDVDTPADVKSAAAHNRGTWLATYIG